MVDVAIMGLGARGGYIYSGFADLRPDLMRITAICDTNADKVAKYKQKFSIPDERCFASAEAMLSAPKLADAMIIATKDRDHFAHAVPAIRKGYHLLLEKPISPSLSECEQIERLAKESGVMVVVCHVLRYTAFFRQIKKIIDSGELGEIKGIEQTENVAYWHYAHSFIRGNWRNSTESSPMILQKCCHDMDIIQWLAGAKPTAVSSFGQLSYFKKENAPKGSTERCTDCAVADCPYSAKKFYVDAYDAMTDGERENNWIFNVLCDNSVSRERLIKAVAETDYGKCAFRCDNDVVDQQVVSVKFENDLLATLTMTAFTKDCFRLVRVYGTKGTLCADDRSNRITVEPFSGENRVIDVSKLTDDLSGHGGGDNRMMLEFLTQIESGSKKEEMDSTVEKSVMSHRMSFAAEASRLDGGKVILL